MLEPKPQSASAAQTSQQEEQLVKLSERLRRPFAPSPNAFGGGGDGGGMLGDRPRPRSALEVRETLDRLYSEPLLAIRHKNGKFDRYVGEAYARARHPTTAAAHQKRAAATPPLPRPKSRESPTKKRRSPPRKDPASGDTGSDSEEVPTWLEEAQHPDPIPTGKFVGRFYAQPQKHREATIASLERKYIFPLHERSKVTIEEEVDTVQRLHDRRLRTEDRDRQVEKKHFGVLPPAPRVRVPTKDAVARLFTKAVEDKKASMAQLEKQLLFRSHHKAKVLSDEEVKSVAQRLYSAGKRKQA